MSEVMAMPPLGEIEPKRLPTVYFIDDSATMREVIKIAFRRESINIVTCADAASALAQFEQTPPDVVITDVIMPDQDGYSVCSQVKQHPLSSGTPVILMSGVVNKNVADRAVAVQADELIRKPFQPQELISRVKSLLDPKPTRTEAHAERQASTSALSSLFAPSPMVPSPMVPKPTPVTTVPPAAEQKPADSVWPRALAEAFLQQSGPQSAGGAGQSPQAPVSPARNTMAGGDVAKLRGEIVRLELQIKKLQTELQIERQYNQALELHVKTLNEAE
ncbi:MAG TPA: response regulator [Candidatus Eremiobacteraceae bacterium]|nr:response regulator [Candidatus Eremiobacteraceae bacterium]